MNNASEQTVREIVLANPSAARAFETFGIDYCCGGKLSLSAACERAKVSVDTVLSSVANATVPADRSLPQDATLGEITQTIVDRHHAFVRRETPRIEGLLSKVISRHGAAHPELLDIQDVFAALSKELGIHMMKEERILFPYVENLGAETVPVACFATVENPISAMIADHEDAGEALAQLRTLSNGFATPEGACPTYQALYRALEEFESDLHWHVHLENNLLFPRAIEAEQTRRNATGSAS